MVMTTSVVALVILALCPQYAAVSITFSAFSGLTCDPNQVEKNNTVFSFNGLAGPSCNELITTFELGGISGSGCVDSASKPTQYALAKAYNMFSISASDSLAYGVNYSSFQINSCTEDPSSLYLERSNSQLSTDLVGTCYFDEGSTNDTTTVVGLTSMKNLKINFNYAVVFSQLGPADYQFVGVNMQQFDSGGFGESWTVNNSLSGLTTQTSDGIRYNADPTLALTAPLILQYAGSNDYFKTIASKVTLSLNPSKDSSVSELTLMFGEAVVPSTPACNLKYRVVNKNDGRDWGSFYNVEVQGAINANLIRQEVVRKNAKTTVPSICPLVVNLGIGGCLDKCISTLTTTSIQCNDFDSSCTSPMPPITLVSGYKGSDCLCGDMSSVLTLTETSSTSGTIGNIRGTLQSSLYSGCVFNYTVGEGEVYGVSSDTNSAYSTRQWGTADLVGTVIAALLVIALFAVVALFGKNLVRKVGKIFMTKFTTPLILAQQFFLFCVAAFIIAGVASSTMIVFPDDSGFSSGVTEYGLFYTATRFTATPYACGFYLSHQGEVFDYQYVNACTYARGAAIVSVVSSVTAFLFLLRHYGYVSIILTIVSMVSVAVTVGLVHSKLINGFFDQVKGDLPVSIESGFYLFIGAFVVSLIAVICAVIDWLSKDETIEFDGATKSTTTKSKSSSKPKRQSAENVQNPAYEEE